MQSETLCTGCATFSPGWGKCQSSVYTHTHAHTCSPLINIAGCVGVRVAVARFETQLSSTLCRQAEWTSFDLRRDIFRGIFSAATIPRHAQPRVGWNPAVERVKGAVHPGIPSGNQLPGFKSHGRRPAFYRSSPPTEISATVLHLFMKISLRFHYRVSS